MVRLREAQTDKTVFFLFFLFFLSFFVLCLCLCLVAFLFSMASGGLGFVCRGLCVGVCV